MNKFIVIFQTITLDERFFTSFVKLFWFCSSFQFMQVKLTEAATESWELLYQKIQEKIRSHGALKNDSSLKLSGDSTLKSLKIPKKNFINQFYLWTNYFTIVSHGFWFEFSEHLFLRTPFTDCFQTFHYFNLNWLFFCISITFMPLILRHKAS